MPLINCQVELSLSWFENCVLSGGENIDNAGAVAIAGTAATFEITDAKRYVPVVTLSTGDNAKLAKQLNEGFKKSVYWNKYKVISNIPVNITDSDEEEHIRDTLHCLFWFMIIQKVIMKFYWFLSKIFTFKSKNWKLHHWNWWKKVLWSAD